MQVKELDKQEMLSVSGGGLTSSFINAITNAINTLYELGKETGSALRRLTNNKYCPINWCKSVVKTTLLPIFITDS